VIGWTVNILDTPTAELAAKGVKHAIGEVYAAPQATLMATLIKGIQSYNLDWQYVLIGVFISIVLELCGIKALSFAVGTYLPLATTLPIFIGGVIRGWIDKKHATDKGEEEDLRKGNLFATGLVAGGALFGVVAAILTVFFESGMNQLNLEKSISHRIGENGYMLLGVFAFSVMTWMLFQTGKKK
jgi:uncharacterized oligopeptide transporter (OPT) family protein